jgi:hypothetical protein
MSTFSHITNRPRLLSIICFPDSDTSVKLSFFVRNGREYGITGSSTI